MGYKKASLVGSLPRITECSEILASTGTIQHWHYPTKWVWNMETEDYPGCLSRLSMAILAQVMISASWDWAPCRAPCSAWSLLLPLPLPPSLVLSLSLKLINKKIFKKKDYPLVYLIGHQRQIFIYCVYILKIYSSKPKLFLYLQINRCSVKMVSYDHLIGD